VGGEGCFRLVPQSLWLGLLSGVGDIGGSGSTGNLTNPAALRTVACAALRGGSGTRMAPAGTAKAEAEAEAEGEAKTGAAIAVAGAAATAALAPFGAGPLEMHLPAGAAGSLALAFAPAAPGLEERAFVLVCDNGTVQHYTLRGRGTDVDVRLQEEDGRPLLAGEGASQGGGSALPLWMGEVVPGVAAARTFCVHNATPLPLPFRWEVARLPVEGGGGNRDENTHNGNYAGGGRDGNQQGAMGLLEWAAVGMTEPAAVSFSFAPARGMLQPGERLQVAVGFNPAVVGPVAARAQLVVDRGALAQWQGPVPVDAEGDEWGSAKALGALVQAVTSGAAAGLAPGQAAGGAAAGCAGGLSPGQPPVAVQQGDLVVAGLLLQGAGAPAVLELDPPAFKVAGALLPGQRVELPLSLRNPTAAPVEFQFEAPEALAGSRLAVLPSGGTVPPGGDAIITLALQPTAAGELAHTLRCRVRHGAALALPVVACVEEPRVAPGASWCGGLSLGLVRMGQTATCQLNLVNLSPFGSAAWSLEQLLPVDRGSRFGTAAGAGSEGDLPRYGTRGSARSARSTQQLLQLEPASGELPPDGVAIVSVSCSAQVPGRHLLRLRLSSGRGAHEACLEVSVTVVVPEVLLEPCR
jgi:hypothetical protein